MSLEEALNRNTAAVEALTAALTKKAPADKAPATPAASKKSTPPAETQTAPPAEAPAAPAAPAITSKMVADALVEVVTKKSRDAGVALLKEYDVAKASELKPAQYADFIAACKAALAPPQSDLV
jgi:hypothetical protein